MSDEMHPASPYYYRCHNAAIATPRRIYAPTLLRQRAYEQKHAQLLIKFKTRLRYACLPAMALDTTQRNLGLGKAVLYLLVNSCNGAYSSPLNNS